MKLSQRMSIPPQVMTRNVGEEVVILDLATGTYFGLDSVGAQIWQHMTEGKTIAETCELLLVEYEVTREELESDTLKLVHDLQKQGLISLTTIETE